MCANNTMMFNSAFAVSNKCTHNVNQTIGNIYVNDVLGALVDHGSPYSIIDYVRLHFLFNKKNEMKLFSIPSGLGCATQCPYERSEHSSSKRKILRLLIYILCFF